MEDDLIMEELVEWRFENEMCVVDIKQLCETQLLYVPTSHAPLSGSTYPGRY